jgi:uncharacterized protein (DUF1810 family)
MMVLAEYDGEHDLQRFVAAQAPVYAEVLGELRQGRKQSHWMWFVFPQIAGLGRSGMAQRYAIGSLSEARAYLAHPVLGRRLLECTDAVLAHRDKGADAIFGAIDAAKLRSSMTLFAIAAQDAEASFRECLAVFFDGRADEMTARMLKA